ncbi:MAG TPA: hypothetical protein VIU62_14470, partial [Chloroflexota bacterium]
MVMSVQVPKQFVWPVGQVPHCPFTHAWPAPQTVPHAPQLVGSEPVLVQEPLQQTSSRVHAVPHEPQLEWSVDVLTQAPPQR